MNNLKISAILGLRLWILAGCGGGSGGGAGRYVVVDAGPVDTVAIDYPAVAGPNEKGQLVGPIPGIGCGDGGSVNGCFNESPYVFTPGHALQTVQAKGNLQGINNNGDIIGFGPDGVSFIIQGGHKTSLGTVGGPVSWAYGINDSDQVVGSSSPNSSSSPLRAFLWQAGRMTDIGWVAKPGMPPPWEIRRWSFTFPTDQPKP